MLGEDQRLLDYLGNQLRKAMGRTQSAKEWSVWAEARVILEEEMAPGGHLHRHFIVEQNGAGRSAVLELLPQDAPNARVEDAPDARQEFKEGLGYNITHFAKAKRHWGVMVPIIKADGTPGRVELAKYWFDMPDNPSRFHSCSFDPSRGEAWSVGQGKNSIRLKNLYVPIHKNKAPHVEPEAYAPYTKLVEKNFPFELDREVFYGYMAFNHQHPELMLQWVIAFQGGYGCGKTSTVKAPLHYKFGKYVSTPTLDTVLSKYRTWLKNTVVWVLDETKENHLGDIKNAKDKLNEPITEEFISVEEKFKNEVDIVNRATGAILTNFKNAMFTGKGQRRVAPLYSAIQTEEDAKKAFDVQEWIDEYPAVYEAVKKSPRYKNDWWGCYKYWYEQLGGAEAVRYFYESVATPAKPGWAPKTTVSEDAEIQGEDDWKKIILNCIEEGELGFSGDFLSMNAIKFAIKNSSSKYMPTDNKIGEYVSSLERGYVKYRPPLCDLEIQQFLPKHEGAKTKFALYCKDDKLNSKKCIKDAAIRGHYEKHLRNGNPPIFNGVQP